MSMRCGVSPEPLERVESTGLRSEDMDDEAEEIHQHPVTAVVAFDVCGTDFRCAEHFFDRIGNRFHLALILP